jgi:glycosyltransferase involved in cell wall biosynthesis
MNRSHKVRIHLMHKLPTPYNDMLFRELAADPQTDLQVHHLWRRSDNRPWTVELGVGYPNRYMHTRLGVDWRLLRLAWQERQSFFLVGDWGHKAAIAILVVRILRRAPVSIWADTPQEHLPRPMLKKIFRSLFLKWLLSRINAAFGTGHPAMDALVAMGAPPGRVINLPCFVDLNQSSTSLNEPNICEQARQYRQRVGCETGGVVFLMSGQCTYKKGQDIGLRAFAVAAANHKAGLLIAGEGLWKPNLETLVESLGIASRVAFLGWLNPDKVSAAYTAADVLLHTARWDPFPLVVLEAMSWSKVVIGTDVCGSVQDRIQHGVSGFVVPVDDVAATAKIMKQVLESSVQDPGYLAAVGQAARRTAEEWPVQRGVDTIVRTASALTSDTGAVEANRDL